MTAQVQKLLSVNYYRGRNTLSATATQFNIRYFGDSHGAGASATGVNDLPNGFLPNNAEGAITAMFCRPIFATGKTQALAETMIDDLLLIRAMQVVLHVNNVDLSQVPVWGLGHPPCWIQGGFSETTASDGGFVLAENAGYQLFNINHDVAPRQEIFCQLKSDQSDDLATATVVEITLQIATKRLV